MMKKGIFYTLCILAVIALSSCRSSANPCGLGDVNVEKSVAHSPSNPIA